MIGIEHFNALNPFGARYPSGGRRLCQSVADSYACARR
jgi:hypothetical protein